MIEVGTELTPTRKVVYQRALDRIAFGEDSIHNDDYTRTQGYPGALVSAYVLAGYMTELMVDFFGASWFTTGKIDLTFIGTGIQQGDAVTCGGRVVEIAPSDNGDRRATLEVWMEKEGGEKVVVGAANATLNLL